MFLGAETDSHQGSSSKRGDELDVTLDGATEHVGLSSRRVNRPIKPEDTLKLDLGDEPVKENPSFTFMEFDMLKLKYIY